MFAEVDDEERDEERKRVLETGLPDPECRHPSDHLPIGCVLAWRRDERDGEARRLIVVDEEGNVRSETRPTDERTAFRTPREELEDLLRRCPYDSERQRSDVRFVLSPIDPPINSTTNARPTEEQLRQIDLRRDKKREVISSSSWGVRPWLKKIWKASKEAGAWERKRERERIVRNEEAGHDGT